MPVDDGWDFPVLNRKGAESLESLTEERTTLHEEAIANTKQLAIDVSNASTDLHVRRIRNRYGAEKGRIKTERKLLDQKILVSKLWAANDTLMKMVYTKDADKVGKKRCVDMRNPLIVAPPLSSSSTVMMNFIAHQSSSSTAMMNMIAQLQQSVQTSSTAPNSVQHAMRVYK